VCESTAGGTAPFALCDPHTLWLVASTTIAAGAGESTGVPSVRQESTGIVARPGGAAVNHARMRTEADGRNPVAASRRGRRRRVAVAATALLLLAQPFVVAQPASAPPTACVAQSGPASLSIIPHVPQILFEIEITLRNAAAGVIHDDPGQITLVSDQGDQTNPLTAAQAKSMISNPSQAFWAAFGLGYTGYLLTKEHQDALMKHVHDFIWTATDIPPGGAEQGSLFFKLPNPKTGQFLLTMDGLSAESGPLPALHVICALVKDESAKGPPAPPTVRTYAAPLHATSGPLVITLTKVEFARDATSADVTVENTSDVGANLFFAKPATVLRDPYGKSYALQDLKTTLDDLVPAHASVRGTLVFAPLPRPPLIAAATLSMPNVQLGTDVLELKMEIGF